MSATQKKEVDHLKELIGQYWSAAHAEGKEGRDSDTEDGLAQSLWHQINQSINMIASPVAANTADAPIQPDLKPIKQLFVQWWTTEMDNAEYFNRFGRLIGLSTQDYKEYSPPKFNTNTNAGPMVNRNPCPDAAAPTNPSPSQVLSVAQSQSAPAPVPIRYIQLSACMYQAAGAYDFPVRWLDVLSCAQREEPFDCDDLLPIMPPPV